MAWNKQKIEYKLHEKLKAEFGESSSDADKYFGYYTYARDILVSENIFNDIKVIQMGLSDHGENHIMEVLSNAYQLLGKKIDDIDSIQLYFICMLILFHDVGNLTTDRKKHHEQDVIREVYDYIRKKAKEFDEERILVPEVASKHSGVANDGTKDTIKELSILPPHLFNCQIHSKKCAALLRFADELAEGPQRTSIFMNKYYNYPYDTNSVLYHKYAEITKINIDRENERVCLTYTFTLKAKNGNISKNEQRDFLKLFEFTICRMLKLEAERKYCKYYCDWLEPFKKTHVCFNFLVDNQVKGERSKTIRIDAGLPELFLDDLTLPIGETLSKFFTDFASFAPATIFNNIKERSNEKANKPV